MSGRFVISERTWALLLGAALVVDLVFGGATHPDAVSSAIARLVSLPLLGLALWRLKGRDLGPLAWSGLALLAAILATPLLQSLPLPPSVWTALPGRGFVAASYTAAGQPFPWLPLSLTPYETQDVVLWLIPAAALFVATLTVDGAWRRWVALVVPAVAVIAVGLGLLQVLGGPESRLRFYSVTNIDSAVGFFANRNHQAAFLVSGLALTPLWLGVEIGGRRAGAVFGLMAALASELLLVVGIAVTHSRAGVLIGFPVLILGAVVAALRGGGGRAGRFAAAAFAASAAIGVALAAIFVRGAILGRFQEPLTGDLRLQSGPAIRHAASSFFPAGAGLGAFDPVYQRLEPLASVSPVYLNHAHNDLLELTLETGALGIALLLAFLLWWLIATAAALSRAREPGGRAALYGGLVVAALLAHSLVDYPLRTTALSCVLALACGFLASRPALTAMSASSSARNRLSWSFTGRRLAGLRARHGIRA